MSLGVGAQLGHYAVTTKIGEGGMGEVGGKLPANIAVMSSQNSVSV